MTVTRTIAGLTFTCPSPSIFHLVADFSAMPFTASRLEFTGRRWHLTVTMRDGREITRGFASFTEALSLLTERKVA